MLASRGVSRRVWSDQARRAASLLALVLCASQVACVQRRFTIRSNPPGARVYVDDYEIGTTPVATDFIYYGTRKVRLVKDGYETLTVLQPVPAPWYEIPPLDFVSENLVPNKIRDERVLDFQLAPQVVVPEEQLLGRADSLRRSTQQPQFAPPGTVQPPFTTPGSVQPGGAQPLPAPPAALPAPLRSTVPPGS